MKTLNLHVDYIKFKPLKKALKIVEELPIEAREEKHVKEALVVLTAVEDTDKDVKNSVNDLIKNIEDISKQVGTKNIVLYPYAHLSKNLCKPDLAEEILEKSEKGLQKKGYEVARAPFGYYKEFELKVKGHPLSELSREIGKQEVREVVVKAKEDDDKFDPKQLLREISKSKLDTSKLKENDHRILGREMDLFSFNEVAPGMVFWHNNGMIIRNELIKYMRELLEERNYEEVLTPQIMDKKIWQISGHWDKYKENNFSTQYEDRAFLIKPMNCPGGLLIFKNSPKSYKDLPLKSGEFGIVHRKELSGVLAGLFRIIQFTQDDAHIFCTEEQLEKEILNLIDLIDIVYNKFGFKYKIELSTRPEKRIGNDKIWDKAESALKKVLDKKKIKYKINEGDGAFYGPKIDFHLTDSLKRTWQCATIQLDFSMPERFGLEYTDKDNKKKTPIMLHRVIYGALERFLGILLEHTNGRLPTWLSPTQVRVLNFTDRNKEYAEKIIKDLLKEIPNLRIDKDFSQTTLQSKVKGAEEMRVPYILTAGDREEKEKTIAVRTRGSKKLESFKVSDFAKKLKKEIENRD
jgi:threonyl-tRNA synthetase